MLQSNYHLRYMLENNNTLKDMLICNYGMSEDDDIKKILCNKYIETEMTKKTFQGNSTNQQKQELPVKFSVELEKKAKEVMSNESHHDNNRYYLLVCTDFETRNTTIVGLERDYNEAILKLHIAYQNYLENPDQYIVRQISATDIMVFKRNTGYVWSSKTEYVIFKLIAYQV